MASIPTRALALVAAVAGSLAFTIPKSALPVVAANDNRIPAGIVRNDTLRIHLVVRMARWYPEAADGPFVDLPVFCGGRKVAEYPRAAHSST